MIAQWKTDQPMISKPASGARKLFGSLTLFTCLWMAFLFLTALPAHAEVRFSMPSPVAITDFVQFKNDSSSDFVNFDWDFGEGNHSNAKNPTHIYPLSNKYTVTLTGMKANGKSEIKRKDIIVTPRAGFTWKAGQSPGAPAQAPLEICFCNTSKNLEDIDSFSWQFGNGTESDLPLLCSIDMIDADLSNCPEPNLRSFDKAAIYDASLTITRSELGSQAQHTFSEAICVAPAIDFNITPPAGKPSVEFVFQISFKNTLYTTWPEIREQFNPQISWNFDWQFNNGSKVNLTGNPQPTHQYEEEGIYTIKLVTQVCNQTFTIKKDLHVKNQIPTAQAAVDSGQAKLLDTPIRLIGSESSDPDPDDNTQLLCEWSQYSFPENNPAQIIDATACDTTFIPQIPGFYTFALTVSDGELSATDVVVVAVNQNWDLFPAAQALAEPNQVYPRETVALKGSLLNGDDENKATPLIYLWQQIEGATLVINGFNQPLASVVPQVPGKYRFSLTIFSETATSDPVLVEFQVIDTESSKHTQFDIDYGDLTIDNGGDGSGCSMLTTHLTLHPFSAVPAICLLFFPLGILALLRSCVRRMNIKQ